MISMIKPDVSLVETDEIFFEFLSINFIILPIINFYLDISSSWEKIVSKLIKNRTRLKRVNEYKYQYEISKNEFKLSYFYYNIYRPYIMYRFKERSHFTSISFLKKTSNKGECLFIKENEQYIGGSYYIIDNNNMYVCLSGINIEKIENLKKDFWDIKNYYLIYIAKKRGFKKIDLGYNYPFVNDGGFKYKKSLNMSIIPSSMSTNPVIKDNRILAIHFSHFKNNVIDFIYNNPFIFYDNNKKLNCLIFLDKKISNLKNKYYIPGLEGLYILYPITINQNRYKILNINSDNFYKKTLDENINLYYIKFSSLKGDPIE